MTLKVQPNLSDRPLTEEDLLTRMNREVVPVIRRLRDAVNTTPDAYTVTNPVERRSFDTTTVTTQQLAEVVGTILSDLGWTE